MVMMMMMTQLKISFQTEIIQKEIQVLYKELLLMLLYENVN